MENHSKYFSQNREKNTEITVTFSAAVLEIPLHKLLFIYLNNHFVN